MPLDVASNAEEPSKKGVLAVPLETVDPFRVKSSGYSFLYEMVWRVSRGGFRIAEVPITFVERVAGHSKINSSEIYVAAFRVLMTALRPPEVAVRKTDADSQDKHR